jgi:D-cysteine desulfhydrase
MKFIKPVGLIKPTPINELKGLIPGRRIYVKRDDLNGLLISGNKARKMEYIIAHALRKKCNTLITCGGVQSNHCRTVAAYARHFGLDCHLFLRGKRTRRSTGNLLIDELLGAKINFITAYQYHNAESIMHEYARKISVLGFRPYVIPEGGSNEIGALGYLGAFKEMRNFVEKQKIDAMYCAVGSGGTYAGLMIGKMITGCEIDIIGIIVCDTVDYFKQRISGIVEKTLQVFKLRTKYDGRDIKLVGGYIGPGYAMTYSAEMKTIKRALKYDLILDPVYTGKAFHGMLNHIKGTKYKKAVFLHTGGLFSIFAYDRDYGCIF